MDKIKAPFTDEQVESINNYQKHTTFHEFTCGSPDNIKNCSRRKGVNNGTLIAEKDCLVCPCGEYRQNWVYKNMCNFIK